MAGRPKIQFPDKATGEKAWGLIEEIRKYRHQCELEDFEKELKELKANFPNATIDAKIRKESAAEIVMILLEQEVDRIQHETRNLARAPNVS